ncbi:MAG: hypothetical protein ACP5QO_02585 [Clostridia bacterium]
MPETLETLPNAWRPPVRNFHAAVEAGSVWDSATVRIPEREEPCLTPSWVAAFRVARTALVNGRPVRLVVRAVRAGIAALEVLGATLDPEALVPVVRRRFQLDDDRAPFHRRLARDANLSWAALGAGRLMRGTSVFEMSSRPSAPPTAHGRPAGDRTGRILRLGGPVFPTPEAMEAAPESFCRDVVRAGYRGAYLRTIADDAAWRRVILEALLDPDRSDEDVEANLPALPGVRPYAAAHLMLRALVRYGYLVLDSWTRPAYVRRRE